MIRRRECHDPVLARLPLSTQYCRASLSAASTASDPLASGYTRSRSPGESRGDLRGQLLDRIVGEHRPVHVAEPAGLRSYRVGDLPYPVAEVRDEGPTAPSRYRRPSASNR